MEIDGRVLYLIPERNIAKKNIYHIEEWNILDRIRSNYLNDPITNSMLTFKSKQDALDYIENI
jgi:hypothetical protein